MILPKHPNTKITKQIGKYILNNYPKLSCRKLSEILKLDHSTISYFLKSNNVIITKSRLNRTNNSSKLTDKQIINLYVTQRKSLVYISKITQISTQVLKRILNQNIRQRGNHTHLTDKKTTQLIIDYKSGKSKKILKQKYNISERKIRQILELNGVKIRNISEAIFKGNKYTDEHGYIRIPLNYKEKQKWIPNNKNHVITEHRLIMSKFLNRPLLQTEQVDHKNGVRHDNRLENLELYSTAHGAGQDVQHTLQRSMEDILRLGKEYLTGKHGKVKMNAKYKRQLKRIINENSI